MKIAHFILFSNTPGMKNRHHATWVRITLLQGVPDHDLRRKLWSTLNWIRTGHGKWAKRCTNGISFQHQTVNVAILIKLYLISSVNVKIQNTMDAWKILSVCHQPLWCG